MSLRSEYSSGDDEEELFRLTAPDDHPDSGDESIAKLEEQSIASSHYDEDQQKADELAGPTRLEDAAQELTNDEIAEVLELIDEIQKRRESGDG